jgi:hypothetical protein
MPENQKMTSWKEISSFLGRDVRTVQRWEKESGLPVHRVPGSRGRTVFAYSHEIDDWLRDTNANASRDSQAQDGGGASETRSWVISAIVVGVVLVAAGLVVFALRTHKGREGSYAPSSNDRLSAPLTEPAITYVSGILPRPDQTIMIKGRDFGSYVSFTNMDTPYLAIRDLSANWAAGRIIDRNRDDVTLSVASWTDSEIIVTGLAGAYGQNGWTLSSGDEIDVAVWNPQTGAGPAIYRVVCGRR